MFQDLTSVTLAKSLDAASMRHSVIANNIANITTPGFKRSDVSFSEQLKQALDSPNTVQEVGNVAPEVKLDETSPANEDGNNVSIDKEMADLGKNTLEYEALVRLLNLKFSMLQTAVTEGRR
ncbi:MAG: flagellar basal body rod protein FlgB [Armatimonadota bacterium]